MLLFPALFQHELKGSRVCALLKTGFTVEGTLVDTDKYMNLLLEDARSDDPRCTGMGHFFIRGNSIVQISLPGSAPYLERLHTATRVAYAEQQRELSD